MIAGIRTAIILDSNPPADFPVVAVDASFFVRHYRLYLQNQKGSVQKNGGGYGPPHADTTDISF